MVIAHRSTGKMQQPLTVLHSQHLTPPWAPGRRSWLHWLLSVSLSLCSMCSESGSISVDDTSCASSWASLREVRVKFGCLSLWERTLYIQSGGVAPTACHKGWHCIERANTRTEPEGKHCMKAAPHTPYRGVNLLRYSPSHMRVGANKREVSSPKCQRQLSSAHSQPSREVFL